MSVTVHTIFDCLATSMRKGTAIGLRLTGRDRMLITTICDLYENNDDAYVVINDVSIYGEPVIEQHVPIGNIKNVVNLRISFNDPFYVNLRALRQNIRDMRTYQVPSTGSLSS